mmetsp:Transcript_22996/g.34576  ORF Transcript_22996/g.34576 Transcript_22996/m.34576 type:complete len:308 (+) Transcript_22996:81-1004(+)
MASSTPIHTLNSDDLQITVAQELFHRLQLRREPLATMQCEDRPAEPQVPRAWLERLRRGEGGGMVSCRLPHDPPSPSTPEQDEEEEEEEASPQMAVHPLPLEAWITKLQARTMEADWPRRREEAKRAAEGLKRRAKELAEVRLEEVTTRYCQQRIEFLRGPRRLREQFGSALNGTDKTADVIRDWNLHVASSTQARCGAPARDDSPQLSPRLRKRTLRDADRALQASRRLLLGCQAAQELSPSPSERSSSALNVSVESGDATTETETNSSIEAAKVRLEADSALHDSNLLLLRASHQQRHRFVDRFA